MPISVSCPECESAYRVPDSAAGKAIKCKKCGARVPVPADGGGEGEEGEAAAGKDAGKKKGGMGKILAIVGAVVVLEPLDLPPFPSRPDVFARRPAPAPCAARSSRPARSRR